MRHKNNQQKNCFSWYFIQLQMTFHMDSLDKKKRYWQAFPTQLGFNFMDLIIQNVFIHSKLPYHHLSSKSSSLFHPVIYPSTCFCIQTLVRVTFGLCYRTTPSTDFLPLMLTINTLQKSAINSITSKFIWYTPYNISFFEN